MIPVLTPQSKLLFAQTPPTPPNTKHIFLSKGSLQHLKKDQKALQTNNPTKKRKKDVFVSPALASHRTVEEMTTPKPRVGEGAERTVDFDQLITKSEMDVPWQALRLIELFTCLF